MSKIPQWCKSVCSDDYSLSGGGADNHINCYELAGEAWGTGAKDYLFSVRMNAGAAMLYLQRRFGPPTEPFDDDKEVCSYTIATSHKGLFLTLGVRGSGLGVGFLATDDVRQALDAPLREWAVKLVEWSKANGGPDDYFSIVFDEELMAKARFAVGVAPLQDPDWRKSNDARKKANIALLRAMKEMLRPVRCRDSQFNILGAV